MTIFNRIIKIQSAIDKIYKKSKDLDQLCDDDESEKLLNKSEQLLSSISSLYVSVRNLLLPMYNALPTVTPKADQIAISAMQISVEVLDQYQFPVYKITLPYLLPNKRERKTVLKNALTSTVILAVDDFCSKNRIKPFKVATVFFLSSYEGNNLNVDNDNKESPVILNGLIGKFIRDDCAMACNTVYLSKQVDEGAVTEIFITEKENASIIFSEINQ